MTLTPLAFQRLMVIGSADLVAGDALRSRQTSEERLIPLKYRDYFHGLFSQGARPASAKGWSAQFD